MLWRKDVFVLSPTDLVFETLRQSFITKISRSSYLDSKPFSFAKTYDLAVCYVTEFMSSTRAGEIFLTCFEDLL